MKKSLLVFLSFVSIGTYAFVPGIYRQGATSSAPSALPVHGPIRPKTLSSPAEGWTPVLEIHSRGAAGNYVTKAIFWGKEWDAPQYRGDKIRGIERFYTGFNNSNYLHTLDEYTTNKTSDLSVAIQYEGHIVSTDRVPQLLHWEDDNNAVVQEICGLITKGSLPFKDLSSFYPVYLSKQRPAGVSCGKQGTGQCAGGQWFSYAAFYNVDNDEACDPHDGLTGHSQGLAALANLSARALSDLVTDWDYFGFYDFFGNEVDDKCAWTFNVPYVTFTNGSIWKLQGLWSNAAYEAGTGYPNANGERGCVDGR